MGTRLVVQGEGEGAWVNFWSYHGQIRPSEWLGEGLVAAALLPLYRGTI